MRAIVDLRGFPTRRAHGLSELEQLEGFPELSEAYTWALEHLPPDEPSVLIHGDLLGQNILVGAWGEGRQRRPEASNVQPESDNGLAVIDWENAMLGDPAYDLAIVTRGSRTPFRMDRGLECLLEAYANFGVLGEGRQRRPEAPNVQTGQRSIAAHEVHFYELCLLARWYRDAFYGNGSGESAGSLLGQLRNVLARARRASSGKVD
jgi:aminoglycoside phosphotransferase (APT) family kinase protein